VSSVAFFQIQQNFFVAYICRPVQLVIAGNQKSKNQKSAITMSAHLSEQEIIRRSKLEKLKALNIEPYPAALYPVTHYSTDIKNAFSEETKEQFSNVCVAGRIMSLNDKGKVFFIKIQDSKGIIHRIVKASFNYMYARMMFALAKTKPCLMK
jgi:lysyl-tRNA synthetase class II